MKVKIKKISTALKDLHRRFLEQERKEAEAYFQKKIAPIEFLTILTQDKNFEWLRPISALIAEIDALVDENEELDSRNLETVRGQVDFLINQPGSPFMERYIHHLNNDADFIMYHSALKQELSSKELL